MCTVVLYIVPILLVKQHSMEWIKAAGIVCREMEHVSNHLICTPMRHCCLICTQILSKLDGTCFPSVDSTLTCFVSVESDSAAKRRVSP